MTNLCLHGLQSSTGYLQKRVGSRIDTRYTPRLKFVLDKGAINAMEVTRILQEVLPSDPADESPDAPADDDGFPLDATGHAAEPGMAGVDEPPGPSPTDTGNVS